MDDKLMQAIEAIIRRGNDAEIRRKGDGYIVLEVKKTIKYSALPRNWARERAIGANC